MSQLNVDTIKNRLGTAGPTVPTISITNNATVGGALTVTGNLTVNGTQTIINTTSLEVLDKTVGIGSTSTPSDALVDGAGVVIYGTTNKTLTYNNTKKAFEANIPFANNENRFITGAEKVTMVDGNTVTLTYNSNSSNVGYCTNPSGNITLNVVGIPTSSDFDSHAITFTVIVNSTGTARTCTAVNLNGVPETIRWAGGSLSAALSGVTTTTGQTIFSFTGINTIGSAVTAANYMVLGTVSGGYW
jgi:hypothetical protein